MDGVMMEMGAGMSASRPSGIVILTILQALGALGWIAIGLLVLVGGGISSLFIGAIGTLVAAIGAALLLIGIAGIAVAYGLWAGKAWARTICLILTVISIFFDVLSILTGVGLVRLLIDVLILYYLTRPRIKEYFKG